MQDLQNQLKKAINNDNFVKNSKKDYLQEDVEIGGDDYEKITVPDLYGSDKNRFIHDFNVVSIAYLFLWWILLKIISINNSFLWDM